MWLVSIFGIAISYLTRFLITKALIALGMTYVAYEGLGEVHQWFEAQFIGAYNSMPPAIYDLATLAGLDVSIKIILSSFATAVGIKTLGAASAMMLKFASPSS